MDMSLVVTNNHSEFMDHIIMAIAAKIADKDEVKQLQQFATLFFTHYPVEELNGHDIHDVIGMLQSNYAAIAVYKQRRVKVQVFNPALEKDQWNSKNTVITVHYNNVPFIIDSVRMALSNSGLVVHSIKNLVMATKRGEKGELLSIAPSSETKGTEDELLMYIEVNRHHKVQNLNELATIIRKTVTDVNLINNHYARTVGELQSVRDEVGYARDYHTREEIYEANQFIGWLMSNNFTFLGYCFHEFTKSEKSPNKFSKQLGVLSRDNDINDYVCVEASRNIHAKDELVKYSKSPKRSTIHRHAYPDHITIQAYDSKGHFIGVHHIVGLYTSQVYRASVKNIPLIRKKIDSIYRAEDILEDSYDGKVLRQVLETFPRDELFQCEEKKLKENLLSISRINERPLIKLFMRTSTDGFFVSAMVYIPKEQFSTVLQERIVDFISADIGANSCDFYSSYSESILSRTYMIFRLDPSKDKQWSEKIIESEIQMLASSWKDQFATVLKQHYKIDQCQELLLKYHNAFSLSYQESFSADDAVNDIKIISKISERKSIVLDFQGDFERDDEFHFKIFNSGRAVPLSDVIPVLERMNLKVIGEHPYKISDSKKSIWLHDFSLKLKSNYDIDLKNSKAIFEDAFINIWNKNVESDFFNGLVLSAHIGWRDITLLRAYAAYMKQIKFPLGKTAIVKTLMAYPDISRKLVTAFYQRFDPSWTPKRESMLAYRQTRKQIIEALDSIENLNHDRVIRQYLSLIDATTRTNFFQKDDDDYKNYVSFKLSPQEIHGMPQPRPKYEIFVYSPRVEGVHLRGGKVARGGLRWSDRNEDFRTEILGLVKAQQVKNAVIVPSGAKGGFVAKKASMKNGKDDFMQEGIDSYKTFISGILDLTDNIVKGKIIPPKGVVRHDGDDAYLVVAADKGTATFSDIGNEISKKYGHWLGDAFASGGSQGYDHKKMGITARGAWVSVQRHFKERGINIQKEDVTVIGIGDMAGDVFGNGMLMSEHICLTAAFNHQHIFVDPRPDAKHSFVERQRLFNKTGSSWQDYNHHLISKGGGVFSRDVKSIAISREMKECFDIQHDQLTPNELIAVLLKAPVDLIWNGGIGTYVKGTNESDADVGDKANDTVRINGSQLRCKVFGEGGNLGLTQKGRIEFSMNGGSCNTDFIDNAAGVDCSDHEVNIKILLSDITTSKGLSLAQRNRLLSSMTDNVAELVLTNNYAQTQSISLSHRDALNSIDEYRRLINALEGSGRLNRALEFIPTDQELIDRSAKGNTLTRPELAVLNGYVKVELKEALAVDEIANDPYLSNVVENIFPQQLRKKYQHNIHHHILRKEIIATQLANDVVNNMGITFCHRMMESTGESIVSVVKAYVVAKSVFQLDNFRKKVEALDYQVPVDDQMALLMTMRRRVRRGTRWFLRNYHGRMDMQNTVDTFKTSIDEVIKITPLVLTDDERIIWNEKSIHFERLGLQKSVANAMSMSGHLFSGLGIVESALNSKKSIPAVVEMHHLLGDKLGFYWFAHRVTDVKANDFWQSMARESFIDDIDKTLRSMTVSLLRLAGKHMDYEEALQLWMQEHPVIVTRWRDIAHDLQMSTSADFALFSVAMRELTELVEVCQSSNKINY